VPPRVFLLSPASCSGKRCQLLLSGQAEFDLARRIREEPVPLGELFSFLSALYFRGKLAYARRFASPPTGVSGVLVITPGRGLLPPDTRLGLQDLRDFARVSIDAAEPRYAAPLARDASALRARLDASSEVVLLGSIATAKYVDVLLPVFARALLFPSEFVGLGDMSRGGLLLRAARDGSELAYRTVDGAERRGSRPPRLERPRAARIRERG
jgi:hypothetical protein